MATWQNRIVGQGVKPASQFLANPMNWRTHPQFQREAVKGSLDTLGWIQQVIENKTTGNLIDGHERVWQAMDNDDANVPYLEVELTEEEEAQALATLDPLSALASTDFQKLKEITEKMVIDNPAIKTMIADLRKTALAGIHAGNTANDPGAQVDKAGELQEKWQVRAGDLWQIGRHRLLCGDSTRAEDVARVMGGEEADAVVTDSPYGMNVEGIANDNEQGLSELFANVLKVLPVDNGIIVNFQGARLFWKWIEAIHFAGHTFERALWMYKPNDGTFPWRGWLQTGQIILISSIGKPNWGSGEYKHDTYVINFIGDELEKEHASPKPVEIVNHLIQWTSNPRSQIYDPFLGSGTTLVACEQTGRIGRGIEISEKYCAVTLERLAGMGLEAKRISA